MRQFRNLPIFVNFNLFTDAERAAAIKRRTDAFNASAEAVKHAKEMAAAVRKYGSEAYDHKPAEIAYLVDTKDRVADEIKRDNVTGDPAWENAMISILEEIYATEIGSFLLRALKKDVRVWLVNDTSELQRAASTTPGVMAAESGGGVRVYFDPYGFPKSGERYTGADILFHELVHAYRSGWKDIKGSNWQKMADYQTAEEFLAVHTQNIFLNQKGKTKFYLSHQRNHVVSVDEVYKTIAGAAETMQVLHHYMTTEPITKIFARWKEPACNVWRDYNKIRERSRFKNTVPKLTIV